MSKTYTIAEMQYSKTDAEALRKEVIAARDEALKAGDFNAAVKLSHVIAFMAVAIEQMWKGTS